MIMQTKTYRYVTVDHADGVATIALDHAAKRNALSLETMRELLDVFVAIGADASVKAVVLRAIGPVFSSGHDLRELRSAGDEADVARAREIFDTCVRLMTAIQSIPQPVIAEVAGSRPRPAANWSPRATSRSRRATRTSRRRA
jgi:enoyl-CoA hydratase/carnithine racemase